MYLKGTGSESGWDSLVQERVKWWDLSNRVM
jgi:hypothetical protein